MSLSLQLRLLSIPATDTLRGQALKLDRLQGALEALDSTRFQAYIEAIPAEWDGEAVTRTKAAEHLLNCIPQFDRIKLQLLSMPVEGLLLQLPEYAKAESSTFDVLLMVVISENRNKVKKAEKAFKKAQEQGCAVPHLIIVEAYEAKVAPSASKLGFGLL